MGAQIQDKKQKKLSILYGLVCIGIMISFWIIPAPEGMKAEGWHLLGIFCATILAIILKVMPIGALSMIAIAIVAITCVTVPGDTKASIKNALSGFNESLIWMIGVAIMISRAIIKTGLGKRIGYYFVSLFGKNTLGIAYSLVVSETILAPVTPSNTARGGAIIHPIMRSIAHNFNSEPETKTQNKIGKYLALVNFQINPITSGMFITATAPNPMVVNKIVEVANNHGIEIDMHITWGMLAAAGNIMMSLTHYATGTAPVIFGSGYASVGEWWKVGFVMSVVSVLVFGIVGGIWWKILGYY